MTSSTQRRLLMWACLVVVVASIVVAVVYFVDGHLKHGLAFLGLAVVAAVGAWFASAPDRSSTTS